MEYGEMYKKLKENNGKPGLLKFVNGYWNYCMLTLKPINGEFELKIGEPPLNDGEFAMQLLGHWAIETINPKDVQEILNSKDMLKLKKANGGKE